MIAEFMNPTHTCLEDMITQKIDSITSKVSETPFTDFIYTDEGYQRIIERDSILAFYEEVMHSVDKKHKDMIFKILEATFEDSLRSAIGDFKNPHKKGLHKCYQVVKDYRKNFARHHGMLREDAVELLSRHIAILDRSLIHNDASSEEGDK